MFEAIIRALLYICGIVLCYFLIVWVLTEIGITIPVMVLHVLMVMLVLVCILVLYRLFSPWFGGVNLWGPGPKP
jgi:hypothetical protein